MKNLFTSKTLIAAAAFAFATFLSPAINRYLETGTWTQQDTKDSATAILLVVTQACLRYAATDAVYTPQGLPGRNKPETDPVEETEIFY